jgi:hypothetical protein
MPVSATERCVEGALRFAAFARDDLCTKDQAEGQGQLRPIPEAVWF